MRRILVADDDQGVAELLRRALERDRYAVTLARDGEEALELFHHQRIDAVVLDIEMPRKSGLEVIRELRSEALDIPIVAISGAGDLYRLPALGLGADAFLAKPFLPITVVSCLCNLLGNRPKDLG